MARRTFALPGIQDLSKDQEDARALPRKGQHLIIGGPGTGKSVLALLRSRRHDDESDNYVFLVYNHLLHQASRYLFGPKLTSQTWNRWFPGMFHECSKQSIPFLPAQPGGTWQEVDWVQVLKIIAKGEPVNESDKLPYLIIDEGQDMPPEFYKALVNMGYENFYVVADQNQQIVSGRHSSRQDIENVLAISSDDVIELKYNYRNSYPTARLAREFYTGDPASPPPALPSMQRTAERPILVEYGNGCSETFPSIIRRILKTVDRYPGKLFGIIAPTNKVRQKYLQAITTANPKLDHGMPKIQTYGSGDDATKLSFDEGGIMLINAQSCKGLEFDIVFLADIDQHYCTPQTADEKRRLFYVMVARAKERVILLKNADVHCPVDSIIPNNPEVIEIRR